MNTVILASAKITLHYFVIRIIVIFSPLTLLTIFIQFLTAKYRTLSCLSFPLQWPHLSVIAFQMELVTGLFLQWLVRADNSENNKAYLTGHLYGGSITDSPSESAITWETFPRDGVIIPINWSVRSWSLHFSHMDGVQYLEPLVNSRCWFTLDDLSTGIPNLNKINCHQQLLEQLTKWHLTWYVMDFIPV